MLNQEYVKAINRTLWMDFANQKDLDPICDEMGIKVTLIKEDGSEKKLLFQKIIDNDAVEAGIQFHQNLGHDKQEAIEDAVRGLTFDVLEKSLAALRGYQELLEIGKENDLEQEEEKEP